MYERKFGNGKRKDEIRHVDSFHAPSYFMAKMKNVPYYFINDSSFRGLKK